MGYLSLLWTMPLAGGVLVLAPLLSERAARWTAVFFAAAVFVYSVVLPIYFAGPLTGPWLLAEGGSEWIFGISYSLALDGLSLSLCWLTSFLTVVAMLASWKQEYSKGFWASFLFLEAGLMGVFLARDLFFFYVFWESVLVPMFFIIGIWGSQGRRHAAMKFFLFTFFGSLFLLVGLLVLVTSHHAATGEWTWHLARLKNAAERPWAGAVFAAIALGFAVKIPIVPLHTWLPDAHTEAPAAGSIMLAGVLLKMGVYGFLRVLIPLYPDLSWSLLPALGLLAAVNILYGSLCALAQSDLKRLVAYSSVAHLGFCLMGIFSRTPEGVAGGSLQMINHGITTGALFLLVGCLYQRSHRRGVGDFGGLIARAPRMTFFFGAAVMASIGVPGLNGFVGEFMSLAGMARALPLLALAGAAGSVLAAAYSLPAYQAVFWGEPGVGSASSSVDDLGGLESALLAVLTALMLVLGLWPGPMIRMMEPALAGLIP